MHRFKQALIAALTLAAFSGPATAAVQFSATLTGDQEVPDATGSPFTGSARFELFGAGTADPSLAFDMLFDPGLNFGLVGSTGDKQVTGLHIHRGERGTNGPVVYGLFFDSATDNDDEDGDLAYTVLADGSTRVTGEWDADEGAGGFTFSDFASVFADAAAGDDVPFYVNLHTMEFPAGEIRGQISAIPLPATLPMLAAGVMLLALRRRTA